VKNPEASSDKLSRRRGAYPLVSRTHILGLVRGCIMIGMAFR
jgi:hypothetical protein